ncbi:cytochrome P450 2C11-like [Discoglossus pictus]
MMDGYSATLLLVLICVSYIFLTYMRMFKERAKLPPGPFPLPFIGNLLQIDTNDISKSFMELKEKYGNIYTFYLGPNPGVVICGYDAMKEALINEPDTFSGRGDYPGFSHYMEGEDMCFSNGEHWKMLRRFALVTLRNFGMGKRSVDERIQEEADFLIKEFIKTKGDPTKLTDFFGKSVSNVICSILFGHRFDYKDKRLLTITESIYRNFGILSSTWGTLFNMYPRFMNYIPGPHKQIYKNFKNVDDIILEIVKHHKETLDPSCPRDFIDCFLNKMMQEKDNLSSAFYTRSLTLSVQNLIIGATETITTTLRYGILILMKYPEITERIQEEIERVVGRDCSPSIEDRVNMPYTDATINEIMRFCDIVPLSLPHSTTRNTIFRGYFIPKGTYITPFLTSVHYDPTQFEEPYKFNPNNFLDENGCFKKKDSLMPFSAGKRICPGESLARMELFIYFTTMLQKFNFLPMIDRDDINIRPVMTGLTSIPMDYQCRIIPRGTMDGYGATLLLVLFCVSYIFLTYVRIFKERAKLPPGPVPLPFIGNLLQIDTNDIVKSFMELKEKYGSIYTFYLGPNPGVVICGYNAMKEALIDESETFGDRGDYPVFSHYMQGHDVAFINGEHWKKLRRFGLNTLRNFGMGKKSIEERIQEEATFLMKELIETKGAPTDLTSYFSNTVSNVICSIIFGSRFDYEDKRLVAITNSIYNNFLIMSSTWGTLFNMYPKLMRYVPGPHKRILRYFQDIEDITIESIKYHEETLDANCPRDYIDCFLLKIMQEKDHLEPAFYKKSLIMTVQNLLFGGTETVSTTLRYGTLILLKYPKIAEKMQEEIDRVVGRDRSPSIDDRVNMPYLDATIHEIMRFCDVIPLSLPHSTSRDTTFRGYFIPKGTYVTAFLTSVHYDPTQFKDPYKFDPNRFLDDKGCFKKKDALMSFSAGKRICMGESLARMELFIFFTTLLQNFNLIPVNGTDQINLERTGSGLGSVPENYQCCVLPR